MYETVFSNSVINLTNYWFYFFLMQKTAMRHLPTQAANK